MRALLTDAAHLRALASAALRQSLGTPGRLHGLRLGSPAFEGRPPQDWGRQGLHNQSAVAAVMGAVAHDARPDFVISTGDNFYNCARPAWPSSNHSIKSFHQISSQNVLEGVCALV